MPLSRRGVRSMLMSVTQKRGTTSAMHLNSTEIEQDHRLGRIRMLDEQRVNLDGFAEADPELGMISHLSPYDPEPSWVVAEDGTVLEMDSTAAADFDTIDEFIVRYAVDHAEAPRSMAMSEVDLARLIVDSSVPREQVLRVCAGLTPAKMARVVAIAAARRDPDGDDEDAGSRRTPANQAHVTNRLDDPLLIAADAATAVVYGFRELEATVPVLDDAPAVAVALLIGSQVPAPGALTQCSVEEARELELGVRGLVSYAETVSVYGTEQVFTDGDDTPWSKAFLTSSYASRGIKMRLSSGAGSEVLMGQAERKSMNYLESRCVSLAKGIGAQGVQNGGVDGAAITASVPGGVRELIAENLMVMLRGLESCSGNDTSHVRVHDAPHQPNAAGAAVRVGLHLLRVRLGRGLRQHVRAIELQRRRPRRLPGDAARLGCRRWLEVGRPDHAGVHAHGRPPRPRVRCSSTSGSPTSTMNTWKPLSQRRVRRIFRRPTA